MSYLKKSQRKIQKRANRRANRVKNNLTSKGKLPRVSVFRSLKQIYAQIIDDATHSTLISFSSLKLKNSKNKVYMAKEVGMELGKMALEKSINKVFFDRGKFLYHGRIKALVEGLRESGLKV